MKYRCLISGLIFCGFVNGADECKERLVEVPIVKNNQGQVCEIQFPFIIKQFDACGDHIVAVGDRYSADSDGHVSTSHVLVAHNLKSHRQVPVQEFCDSTVESLSLMCPNKLAVLTCRALNKRIHFLNADAAGNWKQEAVSSWMGEPAGTLSRFSQDRVVELYKGADARTKLTVYTQPWLFSWRYGGKELTRQNLAEFRQGKEPACVATASTGEIFEAGNSGDIWFYGEEKDKKLLCTEPAITALAATQQWVATAGLHGRIKRWNRAMPKAELVTMQGIGVKHFALLEDGTIIKVLNDKVELWPVIADKEQSIKQ